jgi:hypothetical protein
MTFARDLTTTTIVDAGRGVRAIGWLAAGRPFPQGRSSPAFVRRLLRFGARWRYSTKELWWGTFRGLHCCELCGKANSYGNFGVPAGSLLFVAPEMVVHYVQDHRYAPPAAFVEAIRTAPLPGTAEYRAAVKPFRDRQIQREYPEYRAWKRRNSVFPGVAECVDLLRSPNIGRDVAVGLLWELYENAAAHANELIKALRSEQDEHLRFCLLSTIADAKLPRAVPVLAEQLRSRAKLHRHICKEGLQQLGTPRARRALQEAGISQLVPLARFTF